MTCNRVVIINNGKVVAMDTPEGLIHQTKGGERIALLVDGPREVVREKIQSIDGVVSVQATGGENGQPASFNVECKLDTDLRRTLAATVVSQGWGLLELRGVSLSLEDVFINLVTKE
jgi:ABC-2 type transport system ATP-binding protein